MRIKEKIGNFADENGKIIATTGCVLITLGVGYALLTALESRSYTPTTEDLTAFREELLAEQEAKSFPTLSQTI